MLYLASPTSLPAETHRFSVACVEVRMCDCMYTLACGSKYRGHELWGYSHMVLSIVSVCAPGGSELRYIKNF